MISVRFKLFGAFRKYSNGENIEFQIPENSGLNEVRYKLVQKLKELHPEFNEEKLVFDSAIANETRILAKEYLFEQDGSFSVLPPVCGG
ncbi:MAG: hypothetical protein HY843_05990 [Bdellovibrio sp.]|nr:hypothetical protein [Bdellovibrio sp.]